MQFSPLQPAPIMDVCLSSEQQPGHLNEGPSTPDGWLEAKEEGVLHEDGTGGPPGGNLLLPHLNTSFPGDGIFRWASVTRISISF